MTFPADALTPALSAPSNVARYGEREFDLLIRQARGSQLLGRLAAKLDAGGFLASVPDAPRRHLASARLIADKYAADASREIDFLRPAAQRIGAPLILLKGAAYVALGLSNLAGRLFTDVDILVRRGQLKDFEGVLIAHGWRPMKMSDYDQHYYRTWMHELPPMRHFARRTSLDVHHTILPLTARPRIEVEKIFLAVREAPGRRGVFVLGPEDMILHAVTHLFYDGDFSQGLRELVDIDALLRHFAEERGFWDRLTSRAWELDLARPLWYALRLASRVLNTPAPPSVARSLAAAAPNPALRAAMDGLLLHGVQPTHPTCDGPQVRASRFLLYVRSHALRMPMRLLIPHLARKAAARRTPERRKPA